MAIHSKPPVTPSEIRLHTLFHTAVNESPVNRVTETLEMGGARLEGHIQWDNPSPAEIRLITAWITKLRGAAGRFFMPHYFFLQHQGQPAGKIVIAENNSYGAQVKLSGATPSTTAFDYGDWVSINNQLVMVVDSCKIDSLGKGVLTFEPPLRHVVQAGEVVVYDNAQGIFRLKDDKQGAFSLRQNKDSKIKLAIVEAV
ncbi:hypothetical protein NFHSH190041_36730 (plasmid) [Shewanella sp. NFH-SH190041]|uniref:hypothetical protein n=1 Tax=Shewanella sp. NFH-SH190041 TaxID=2950245 RepID=UPI0021C4B87A|nr:hypothetical protein [Shewanella sp. NFH-SH190041]BDM66221.1 hypothetical protein NFHSH190041_36730 [Shewanella sp. NFH-SH190041]